MDVCWRQVRAIPRQRTLAIAAAALATKSRIIKTAKARGFVTLDALNAVLPSEEVSPDQIEDTLSMLSDMGITVVESEEAEAPHGGIDKPHVV